MMAVSSQRQRGHTKRTSCGDEDQLERLTLAAIGLASQCEHDTRKPTGIEHTHSIGLRVLPAASMTNPCESFRCPSTLSASSSQRRRSVGTLEGA
ncbi:hypothetical protein ACVWXQ_002114 [Bradyrhizobium sp. S3.14.4]